MSVQNVMTFVNKLEGNTELQNQIKSLTPGNPAAVVKLAADCSGRRIDRGAA